MFCIQVVIFTISEIYRLPFFSKSLNDYDHKKKISKRFTLKERANSSIKEVFVNLIDE